MFVDTQGRTKYLATESGPGVIVQRNGATFVATGESALVIFGGKVQITDFESNRSGAPSWSGVATDSDTFVTAHSLGITAAGERTVIRWFSTNTSGSSIVPAPIDVLGSWEGRAWILCADFSDSGQFGYALFESPIIDGEAVAKKVVAWRPPGLLGAESDAQAMTDLFPIGTTEVGYIEAAVNSRPALDGVKTAVRIVAINPVTRRVRTVPLFSSKADLLSAGTPLSRAARSAYLDGPDLVMLRADGRVVRVNINTGKARTVAKVVPEAMRSAAAAASWDRGFLTTTRPVKDGVVMERWALDGTNTVKVTRLPNPPDLIIDDRDLTFRGGVLLRDD